MSKLEITPNSARSLTRIELEPIDAGPGAPATSLRELGTLGGVELGVWEMAPGVAEDTEADEVFVVLSGSGVVAFLDSGDELHIGRGDLVRLAAGTRTRWTVTSTLRKLYLAP